MEAWRNPTSPGAWGKAAVDVGLIAFSAAKMGRAAAGVGRAGRIGEAWSILSREFAINNTQTTAHGFERIAGSSATRGGVLSIEGINSTKFLGKAITQTDGATVYLHEIMPGKFNAVVEGQKGIITTMENWSQKSINRIAKNYGWKIE